MATLQNSQTMARPAKRQAVYAVCRPKSGSISPMRALIVAGDILSKKTSAPGPLRAVFAGSEIAVCVNTVVGKETQAKPLMPSSGSSQSEPPTVNSAYVSESSCVIEA